MNNGSRNRKCAIVCREIDRRFDSRYSRRPLIFTGLIREGRLDSSRLNGPLDEKSRLHPHIAPNLSFPVARPTSPSWQSS